MADELTARGGRLVFVVYPLLHALDAYPFEAEHDRLDAMARRAGAEVVDLRPVFRGLDASTLWASEQDHHPNAAANVLATGVIATSILAGPVRRTGPFDCAAVQSHPRLESAIHAACRGGPAEHVALAEEVSRLELVNDYLPMYPPTLVSTFAARAGWLAERGGDPVTADSARALLARPLR